VQAQKPYTLYVSSRKWGQCFCRKFASYRRSRPRRITSPERSLQCLYPHFPPRVSRVPVFPRPRLLILHEKASFRLKSGCKGRACDLYPGPHHLPVKRVQAMSSGSFASRPSDYRNRRGGYLSKKCSNLSRYAVDPGAFGSSSLPTRPVRLNKRTCFKLEFDDSLNAPVCSYQRCLAKFGSSS